MVKRLTALLLLLLTWTQPVYAATTFLDPGTSATFGFELFAGTSASSGTITSDTSQVRVGPRSIKSPTSTK